jgi:hypothetical protein
LKNIGTQLKKFLGLSSVGLLLMFLLVQGCSVSRDPVAVCKERAASLRDPDAVRKSLETPGKSGSTIPADWIDKMIEITISDSEAPRLEFTSCMTDFEAMCYVDASALIPDDQMVELLKEREWESPTKWDCFWPKTKTVVANPFK